MAQTETADSQQQIARVLRESALWIFGGVSLLMFTALVSYNPADPGFTDTGEAGSVDNAIGTAGAWFADFSYLLLGHTAYLIPLFVALLGWLLYSTRRTGPVTSGIAVIRLGGFLLTLFTSAGLATLHFSGEGLPGTAGGILGSFVGAGLSENLGLLGATLLLLALWLAGVAMFTGISWIAAMDSVGRVTLNTLERLRDFGVAVWRRVTETRRKPEIETAAVIEPVRKTKKMFRKTETRIEPTLPTVVPSARAEKERQTHLFEPPKSAGLPPLSELNDPPPAEPPYSEESLQAMSRQVEMKLRDFDIEVEVVSVQPGPVVTRFELNPAPGIKVSKITGLSKDLARALSAVSVRVVEVIPGKSVIGLEIPNERRELVSLGEVLRSKSYDDMKSPLTLALGKDIGGHAVVANLGNMPHLLIAGTTGAGKSVALNAMILSLLYKATAEHVRMIMVDPKMLELSVYEGIPHLLAPVVTDMKEAANALRWCIAEMERRYKLMSALGVRNIGGYNRKVKDAAARGEPLPDPLYEPPALEAGGADTPKLTPLPYVVVVIDELADLMMLVGKKVEELIARLAQKARASGIHLVLATQRPSVDVITGLIKANIPARIAFQVSSRVDSRTILDQIGAEHLLGHGDMLFLPPGTVTPVRVHGAFVADDEVHRVVRHLKQAGEPTYLNEILEGPSEPLPGEPTPTTFISGDVEQDVLYDEAVRIVTETRKASISGVQRRLRIGYNRAARIVEAMEEAGIVGPLETNGAREILAPPPPAD